jgi:hypothetical protein
MYAGVVAVPLIIGTALERDSADEGPILSEGPAPAAISDADEARLDPERPMGRDLGLHPHQQDKR